MSTGKVLQSSAHPQPSGSANGAQIQNPHDDTSNSPAVHSGRLIYAKPQDLPSFPSVGLGPNGSAASAAATLGWSMKNSPEIWKPDSSSSASKAALLAHGHKAPDVWTPSLSSHGAQAALLAHKSAKTSESWKPTATDHGHSAATQAFKAGQVANLSTQDGANLLNRQRSLMAAKGAMAVRPRSNTAPSAKDPTYPDEANAAANALKAATAVHKAPRQLNPAHPKGGAVPFTTMNRQMFTSHPPVKLEVEEQTREEQLRAEAVAMAKKMFTTQQKMIDQTKKSQTARSGSVRHTRSTDSLSSDEDEVHPMQFSTLQDAAYKLAQQRLAKLHEDNLQNREYQEYYGQSKPQRRSTLRGKLTRRRSSSDGDLIEDQKRSQQIRTQMSIFNSKLSQVDVQKRQQDRDALMAAAQRNVQARLKGMDDEVSAKTGMAPISSSSNWEAKAHAAAQSRSENRMTHHGKIDIGAGKYMTQEEIDAIAAQKVQPTLDEINDKAEKERARQTELKLEAERKKEAHEREKAREREIAAIDKKLKDQQKQEEKDRKAEEKIAKGEKHKSLTKGLSLHRHRHEQPRGEAIEDSTAPVPEPIYDEDERVALNDVGQPVRVPAPVVPVTTENNSKATRVEIPQPEQVPRSQGSSPTDKVSPTGKVKTWFKSHFSRGSKSDDEKPQDSSQKGFVGGHALTGIESNNASTTSLDGRSASMRAIAMAGRRRTDLADDTSAPTTPIGNAADVSPMSSDSDDEFFDEARDELGTELSPPRHISDPAVKKSHSPVRDSRFHENI
ncbi:hypothetical protein BKA67DRAFT_538908 [Truncatella angustata]|uniref:Eisosome protein 1 n=1 Tax=Truncatella angustata TaxID=152316 RepID=A0A9P8UFD4_9PEZI|nr:uncharacterized protein BKA67DRAFT_538908 [Truncatella angustata]KAH6648899.1 hypothetical protein BKA67DRAFT_538908 [Truncatella angustata]KAH8198867.1 hypothetical protein TruAng_006975 [Truncatella angustata]